MDPIQQLDAVIPTFCGLAEQVEPEDLTAETPCARWQVRDLLNHVAGGAPIFAGLFRGEPGRPFPQDDQLGDDPAGAVRDGLAAFDAAVRSPGALERTLETPFGTMPGETFARLAAFDLTVHSWDLATALGRPVDLPDDVVGAVDGFARAALTPALRGPETFGPEVMPKPDAGTLDRLVAFAGRTP